MSDISQIGHKLKVAAGVFTQFKPKTNKYNTWWECLAPKPLF